MSSVGIDLSRISKKRKRERRKRRVDWCGVRWGVVALVRVKLKGRGKSVLLGVF